MYVCKVITFEWLIEKKKDYTIKFIRVEGWFLG